MPTFSEEIGPKTIARAKAAAEAGEHTAKAPLIFKDTREKGLFLRVQGGSVGWLLRYNGKAKSLGSIDNVKNASAARELARSVRALMKEGTDPKNFLTGKALGKSDDEATEAAQKATKIAAGGWTWETLVTEYAEGYLGKPRLSKGRIKPPSEGSVRTARDALSIPEADILKGKLLTELGIPDLEAVRDAAALRTAKTPSRSFVSNAKAALSFAKRKFGGKSGLHGVPKWWLEVQILDETAVQSRTRMPSLQDLGRVLYVAEKHRVAGGRKAARVTSEVTVCALWWLIFTVQRSTAAMGVRKERILPWPEGPNGWKLATWDDWEMKSRHFHALPVPPRVALLMERAIAVAPRDSQYVFCGLADRGSDRPISTTATRDYIDRLRGKPPKSPKGRKRKTNRKSQELKGRLIDHLEGVPHFSAHDLRRTFATTCSDKGVRPDAISAVLDHAGIETGQKMLRSADVTRLAYDYSQRLAIKAEAMEAWCDAVFGAAEAEWAKSRPLGQVIMPPRQEEPKGVPFSPLVPWYKIMESRAARVAEERGPLDLSKLKSDAEMPDFNDAD